LPDALVAWLQGDLTPAQRIWTALAPALLACAYFLAGLVLFCVRCLVRGMPRDEETLQRGASVLVGFFLRHYFFWVISPLWRTVLRSGIPANALTALATLLSVASGVALANGRFALGGWLFLLAGILDVLDGRIARASGTASPAGAALDSVLDRVADSSILIGLGWYYRDSWVLLAVLVAFMGTSLVPYVRARGEGLGVNIRGGGMERLERVLFLGVGVALSPILEALVFPHEPRPMHWLAVAGLLAVAVGSNFTAMKRLSDLIGALTPRRPLPSRRFTAVLILSMLAGGLATAVDFGAVVGMVELGGVPPALATALGCGIGAVVNYSFNRVITFRSHDKVAPQMARYALVSATSAALNTGGLALLLLHPSMPYQLAWWLARGAVYFAWNLPLQREYVFGDRAAAGQPDSDEPLVEPQQAA
jgi:phosphatidylglycerophosphate synthase/putative flippase GtrA